MPDRNERTSKAIASKASAVMVMSDDEVLKLATKDPALVRSIAASALTQARDHEKPADEAEPTPER